MEYSLSNVASITMLHEELGVFCKYPNIYKTKLKIDGQKEQTISVITMDDSQYITQAVWGILPQDFEGDWKKFQKIRRTLHVKASTIPNNILFREALQKRRCIVVVTGYYMHLLKGKKIESFLVEKSPLRPFYLAGVYNVLEDGFVTCSIINVDVNETLNSINNLYEVMPLQIPRILKEVWLDKKTSSEEIAHILSKPYATRLSAQKISS